MNQFLNCLSVPFPLMSNVEPPVRPVPNKIPFICPISPVVSPETVNALHVYPVNPITAIETIHELSSCSVSSNVSVLPVQARESIY